MKRSSNTIIIAVATALIGSSVLAQAAQDAENAAPMSPGFGQEVHESADARAEKKQAEENRAFEATGNRDRMVSKFDTDGDGQMSLDERRAAQDHMARTRQDERPVPDERTRMAAEKREHLRSEKIFDMIDADGDSSLSREEFYQAMAKLRAMQERASR